jgi:hypothetical protein
VLAWRRLPHLREPERFEAWCHRILVHACYDESARTRRWRANVGSCGSMDRPGWTTRGPSPIRTSWAGVPQAADRPAGRVRAAPLRRAAAGGDRRDPRHPRRHRPIATAHYATRVCGRPWPTLGSRDRKRPIGMSGERRFEQTLGRGSSRAGPRPDHAVQAALTRIETTPGGTGPVGSSL